MAIQYYTGVPRSGKSYKAVVLLYYTFVKPKNKIYFKIKDYVLNEDEKIISFYKFFLLKIYVIQEIKFDNAYTNINQFSFEISEKILKLDFNDLYNKLKILHNLYLLKKTDYELIEKAKELNIYRTLFVIDECHNYLKAKEDSVLVWWFTYHAHLHHELILITQDLTLVNTEYKRVAEYFYRAISSRFRMSKNTFKYIQYSTAGMYEKDKIGTDTVKANSKIFSLFVSGSDSNGKSIIHKYILMALVALIACFFSIYSFFSNITPEEEKNIKNDTFQEDKTLETPINTNTNIENLASSDSLEKSNLKLFKFNCFSIMCYYTFQDNTLFEIPQNILKTFLSDIDDDKKYLQLKNNKLMIYVLTTPQKFNFIKERGLENENNQNENLGIIPGINN